MTPADRQRAWQLDDMFLDLVRKQATDADVPLTAIHMCWSAAPLFPYLDGALERLRRGLPADAPL